MNRHDITKQAVKLSSVLALALAATCMAGAVEAEEPAATTATYGTWILRCVQKPARNCEIVQSIQIEGEANPIAILAVGLKPGGDTLAMTAVLPVNITLSAPAHIASLDEEGKAEKAGLDLQWQRCAPAGCFASSEVGTDSLEALSANPKGQIQFTDAGNRKITIPLSWAGLQDASNALKNM